MARTTVIYVPSCPKGIQPQSGNLSRRQTTRIPYARGHLGRISPNAADPADATLIDPPEAQITCPGPWNAAVEDRSLVGPTGTAQVRIHGSATDEICSSLLLSTQPRIPSPWIQISPCVARLEHLAYSRCVRLDCPCSSTHRRPSTTLCGNPCR